MSSTVPASVAARSARSIALLVVACALLLPTPAAAVPKSLFVQVTSVPRGDEGWRTRSWFRAVCENHRTPGSADYIHNLVLSEIATPDGALDDAGLSIVEEYFDCFDNIFVGTANLLHPDPYVAGMKDETFRWDNIRLSRRVADAWAARARSRLGGRSYHWYVSYEANLNALPRDAALHEAYVAFLDELSRQLNEVRPGAVMWSPAFWSRWSSLSGGERTSLESRMADLFARVPNLTWFHFQDFVGQASRRDCSSGRVSYGHTSADGIAYYAMLQRAAARTSVASLRVNMEHFVEAPGCGTILPGDDGELRTREAAYQGAGVPIGASWEIRWWYRARYGDDDISCRGPEICNGVDDDCDRRIDEDDVCAPPADTDPPDPDPPDTGRPDTGRGDAGSGDASTGDAGAGDAGAGDAGAGDAGPSDIGAPDVEVGDSGPRDSGLGDVGVSDASDADPVADAGLSDAEDPELTDTDDEVAADAPANDSASDEAQGGDSPRGVPNVDQEDSDATDQPEGDTGPTAPRGLPVGCATAGSRRSTAWWMAVTAVVILRRRRD